MKIGKELQAHQDAPATIILLGDGIDLEPALHGDGTINFAAPVRSAADSAQLEKMVDEFEPLLKPLAGSCVMLVVAGAANKLSDARILTAQQLLAHVLQADHVGFVPTRSSDLPPSCTGGRR